jgi:AcrR family transcriptional regulator
MSTNLIEPAPAGPRGKYRVTPLRQAKRELTRARIRDAARELFHENHYDATTMDQIAVRAGMTRSSVYLHYKDKSAILAEIVADYAPRAEAQMATLPGPNPSVEQLVRWIDGLADFFEREQISLAILAEPGSVLAAQAPTADLVQRILTGLGRNNPAFRKAAAESDPDVKARAVLLVLQLTFVGQAPQRGSSRAWTKSLQRALAESFEEFIRRFND